MSALRPKRRTNEPRSVGRPLTHGITRLKEAVNGLGNKLIDKRTVTGRALAVWRKDLIADLGGDVSTQQLAVIEVAVKNKLLLDSIDTWLLTQPTLVNKKKKSVLPAVREGVTLADSLPRCLEKLGLERRAKMVSLQEILAKDDNAPTNANGYERSPRSPDTGRFEPNSTADNKPDERA